MNLQCHMEDFHKPITRFEKKFFLHSDLQVTMDLFKL